MRYKAPCTCRGPLYKGVIIEKQKLYILWASGDPLTAHHMVLQYAVNCITQDWWDEVQVIIWGASAKLLAEDEGLQERVRAAMHVGVKFSACSAGARQMGAREKLQALNIPLEGWGSGLSRIIQEGECLITV